MSVQILALLAAAVTQAPSSGYVAPKNPKAYRLSGDALPEKYTIQFEVDPAQGVFSGVEVIAVRLTRPTTEIVLHAADLQITNARIGDAIAEVIPHPESETVSLLLPSPAQPAPFAAGALRLTLAFRAKLRDDLRGFYLVKAKDGTPYAVTQFEPTDARRAFPCFDEPAYKAVYEIHVAAPAGLQVIGNAPELSVKTDKQVAIHTFAPTPPISSYLVALAVGRFAFVDDLSGPLSTGGSPPHLPIRVVTLPGQEELGRFALGFAKEVMPWYESYFGIKYPYAKLDLVAVPDFEAGAMENAGAIFFRDRDLLLDPKHGSVQGQKLVAIVVAHEMAHQWFGDLVTMKWWDDLWLNEAFASLMENESVAALRPNWHIWDEFRRETEGAFYDDSLKATHPIHSDVATAEEANEAFDNITYIKGQATLRMLELYLGPSVWQKGIHDYLSAHALGNATEADLWEAQEVVSKKPVAQIAKSWFEQPGYPLVTVKRAGKSVQLTQQRFFLNPKEAARSDTAWQIPLCVKLAAGSAPKQECQLVTGTTAKIELSAKPVWVDANAEASGFYRVRYADADLKALGAAVRGSEPSDLSAPEKIALLEDSWALAENGSAKLAPELQLVAHLPAVRNAAVLGVASGTLHFMERYLLAAKDRPLFSAFVESVMGPTLKDLGWTSAPGEDVDRRELRATAIGSLGVDAQDPAVVEEARQRLVAWEKDPGSLDPTLVGAVLGICARHGDQKLWDDFKARMDAAVNPEDHDHFMSALADFRDPQLIQKSLGLVLSGGIRKQDVAGYLGHLVDNREAAPLAWAFVKEHWTDVVAHSTAQSMAWRFIPSVGSFCTAADRADAASFFAAHKVESGDRPLRQALESIDLCLRTTAQHKGELGKWLASHRPPGKATASR